MFTVTTSVKGHEAERAARPLQSGDHPQSVTFVNVEGDTKVGRWDPQFIFRF